MSQRQIYKKGAKKERERERDRERDREKEREILCQIPTKGHFVVTVTVKKLRAWHLFTCSPVVYCM
jgi:hypothetical protein